MYQYRLSGVHINYLLPREIPVFAESGFTLRKSIQFRFVFHALSARSRLRLLLHFRWTNWNERTKNLFASFDDFLSCFTSKRRKEIKRERRKLFERYPDLQVDIIRGNDKAADASFYATIHSLYANTVNKKYGNEYLSAEFFHLLSQSDDHFRQQLLFIVARNTSTDTIIAMTMNAVSKTHFYGRYWGSLIRESDVWLGNRYALHVIPFPIPFLSLWTSLLHWITA